MGILGWIASIFASNKVQDLAIDGLRQVSGLNEMTAKEKSEYIIKYIEVTKHQSPMRRLIAFTLTMLYALVILLWLGSAVVGYVWGVVPALELAGAVKIFMGDVIVQPFNIILSFYFVTQIAGKFGK
jgi:uncharacterized membrane protein